MRKRPTRIVDTRLQHKFENGNGCLHCATCKYANHDTDDFHDGFLACKLDGTARCLTSRCDITFTLKNEEFFAYEKYNGANGLWDIDCTIAVSSITGQN